MPSTRLKRAVRDLADYYQLDTFADLISATSQSSIVLDSLKKNKTELEEVLIELLIDVNEGSYSSPELVQQIKQISNNSENVDILKNSLNFIYSGETKKIFGGSATISEVVGNTDSINEDVGNSSRDTTTCSAIQIFNNVVSPKTRNTSELEVFMNAIPTMEMNRAVPYLNIDFNLARSPLQNGKLNQISPLKYLLGGVEPEGGANKIMSLANTTGRDEIYSDRGSSGMEIFQMPQTLSSIGLQSGLNSRPTRVIDPFAPLASIVSFEISETASHSAQGHQNATLKILLHDRSRLHELADYIYPDNYSQSELVIEYGWAHPDGKNPNNVWGRFIDSLRKTGKYQISNTSYTFEKDGSVSIVLKLTTKGAIDLYIRSIYEGEDVLEMQTAIKELQTKVSEIRERMAGRNSSFIKEIRGEQILKTASDQNSSLELTSELRKELRKTVKLLDKNKSEKDATELRQLLVDLYGNGKVDSGKTKTLRNSISSAIAKKMARVLPDIADAKIKQTPDPFLESSEEKAKIHYISFLKLMLIFVAEPLAATHKFDDIQLITYNLNSKAGAAHDKNIGSFRIDSNMFQELYRKMVVQRGGSANMNLRGFISFLTSNFFDDVSSINYGMRSLYDYEANKETGSRIKPKKRFQETKVLNSEIEKIMKESGIPDGTFVMPQVQVHLECTGGVVTTQGQTASPAKEKTILRIHVFDAAESSYSTLGELRQAQTSQQLSTLGDLPVNIDAEKRGNAQDQARKIIEKANSLNLIEKVSDNNGGNSTYQVKGSPNKMKEFIKNNMPYMVFGSNNSMMKGAGLSSMTDKSQETIHMTRVGFSGDLSPDGVTKGGLPMKVLGAKIDLPIVGCPIVSFYQDFFVDFETGTTADNQYQVTGITHTIKAGKFDTKLKLHSRAAYGKYQSAASKVESAIKILSEFTEDPNSQKPRS